MQHVGLAQANAAVNEQRIVSVGWVIDHRLTSGMRQTIGGTNHEIIKAIARVELRVIRGLFRQVSLLGIETVSSCSQPAEAPRP